MNSYLLRAEKRMKKLKLCREGFGRLEQRNKIRFYKISKGSEYKHINQLHDF